MKDLYIVGAGAFGREVAWVVERINAVSETWDLRGFIDDDPGTHGTMNGGYPVLGGTELLLRSDKPVWVVCAIGTSRTRRKVISSLLGCPNVRFATLIDPTVIQGARSCVGEGTIICQNVFLAVDSVIGDHVIINVGGVIGHDDVIGDYVTVNPSVNVSGEVHVGACTDLGTGSKIIQGKKICAESVIGAGAVVVRDIEQPGTYVGVPAKMVNKTRG